MTKTKKGLPDGMKIDTEGNLYRHRSRRRARHLAPRQAPRHDRHRPGDEQLRVRRRRAYALHDRRLLRDARAPEGEGQGLLKALLLSEPGSLSITDVPMPSIGDDDVLVRVRACGVCGSDVHGYDGSTGRRIPPLVMGHEAAGVIERIGSGGRRSGARRPRHLRFHGVVRSAAPSAGAARSTSAIAGRCLACPAATIAGTARLPNTCRCRRGSSTGCPTRCRSSTRRSSRPCPLPSTPSASGLRRPGTALS